MQVSEIGTTLGALVGGAPISKFDRDNRSYDVVSQVPQENRLNPERLGQYYVRAANGVMVPLSALVRIETGRRPAAIETVQPAQLRDHLGPAAADRDDERRARDAAPDRSRR